MHYNDVIMSLIVSQITSLTIVYTTVYSDVHQRKHQNSASLAFVRGIHRGPVNSPHKGPVTRKIFPFDDVIMDSPSVDSKATNQSNSTAHPQTKLNSHSGTMRVRPCVPCLLQHTALPATETQPPWSQTLPGPKNSSPPKFSTTLPKMLHVPTARQALMWWFSWMTFFMFDPDFAPCEATFDALVFKLRNPSLQIDWDKLISNNFDMGESYWLWDGI